jgi:adenine-specific DNA-methyltransferase
MGRPRKSATKKVEDYRHDEAKRVNNPPAGLAWQDTEKPVKRRFEYDPHLDPQLVWAGKAERQSFEVEAPSIHVHERLSADDIIRSVMKEPAQPALFDYEELDRTKAVDFYRHEMGWENRLILGDSLVVMTSLLEKERLRGQVQMIYIDPPYGVNYRSNFQPRLSVRDVKERDADLTREPEQIRAYRDTWERGVHSYLTYLRDRFTVAHDLLAESGSIFVQISNDHVHRVRDLLDEVFGSKNFCSQITFLKTSGTGSPAVRTKVLSATTDFLLWYAKDVTVVKYRQLYLDKELGGVGGEQYTWVEESDGTRRRMTTAERNGASLPHGARVFRAGDLTSQTGAATTRFPIEFAGRTFRPVGGRGWATNREGIDRLLAANRLHIVGNTLSYVRYLDDFPAFPITDVWLDTRISGFAEKKRYVVQTTPKVLTRCIAMTTDPGDLVLDPTSGSGTTAAAAELLGRRWIACDTSRVAVALTRERLLTQVFPFFRLADAARSVDGGFAYRAVPRVTLASVARAHPPEAVALYDQPEVDSSRVRVAGPFTVEALSRYAVNPNQDNVPPEPDDAQASEPQDHVATLLAALVKQGIPRRGGAAAKVLRVEPLANAGALHAEGVYQDADSEKSFAVSLGARFGPVTVQQIDEALHEAYGYDLVVFAGFAATAEAQQYVADGKRGRFNVALLEVNPDLLVGDLLKTTSSSQTFRLFAAPDVKLTKNGDGDYTVQVLGVDLFDAATGDTRFAGDEYIAAWFLDTDYDGMVFHVNQAFFPDGGWEKLAKTLKGTVDEELMEQLQSFESLPFKAGEHGKAAVRVIDDAGTTSEVVLELE